MLKVFIVSNELSAGPEELGDFDFPADLGLLQDRSGRRDAHALVVELQSGLLESLRQAWCSREVAARLVPSYLCIG